MDGFEVIRAIREREQLQGGHLPVIALTARSRKEDRQKCIDAGMDAFLAKPIQAHELHDAIEQLVGAERVTAPENARRAAARDADLLDARTLVAACGDDGLILNRLCQKLRECLPGQLSEIREALGTGNAIRLREGAHRMQGMIAAFSSVAASLASQ